MKPLRKRSYLFIAALLCGSMGVVNAQTDNDEEITVKNKDGKESIIDVPEGMTVGLDSLLMLYNSQLYLHPDTTCETHDYNPVFEKEVYIDRLKRIPCIIELPYNDIVQQFIDRYSGRLRRSVSYMLGASNFYMPIFEDALEAYGLPLELKYLPVIESALNPNAVSRVGATGLWQFILSTGKRYGLTVNSLVDERRDPVKASYAAAHYLSDLYKIFGDWNLVIAAYNAGPDNINKAIHRSNGSTDYWQIYPYLPKETRGYVPAFIAANYIMNYYGEHNICPMITDLPVKTDTVIVNRDVYFEQIARVCNINIEHLRSLNPQYRCDIVNGYASPSALRLPVAEISTFIDNEDSIYAYQPEVMPVRRNEVDVNEAVPVIQRSKPVVTWKYAGRRYGKHKKGAKKVRRERSKSISVRNGDTLSEIARRNKTTVKQLRRLNKINGTTIRAGKKIRIK